MNIGQAKEELIHTVLTYTAKDENGNYRIPRVRQRPVLLMGPPGIGKTAIMEQVAEECGIGLISYTMTHHTRQSAIGLPVIQTKVFGGQEYTVTEYTMSEIIASVYTMMERTGCREGILFLDEINCVSETLAPTMLQFLQNKAFGGHRLPDGWVIAAAGNPREYNKAARDFDIATLDRVRRIHIYPELDTWKKYAFSAGIHGSILSYLNCRPDSFYHIKQTAEGVEFVTARGWEDLSVMLKEHERQGFSVTEELVEEYLCCEEIAEDFYAFYRMTCEYQKQCPIDRILNGTVSQEERKAQKEHLQKAQKDETFSVSGWLLTGILYHLDEAETDHRIWKRLEEMYGNFLSLQRREPGKSVGKVLEEYVEQSLHALMIREQNALISETQIREEKNCIGILRGALSYCRGNHIEEEEQVKQVLETECKKVEERWKKKQKTAALCVQRGVNFLVEVFGAGEETLCFFAGISSHSELKEMEAWEELQEYRETVVWLQIDSREKQVEKLIYS